MEHEIEEVANNGKKTVGLYGYPVLTPPGHILQAAAEASSSIFSPPSAGLKTLRQGIAEAMAAQLPGSSVNPETEILITSGAMHALHVVFTSLVGPGDEVLLISPCYFFGGLIQLTGAKPVYVEMEEKGGYSLDFNKVRRYVSNRTKLMILSSPVNPTGYVYTLKDLESFISIAEEYNIMILSDESYDRLIYDGLYHFSPFADPAGRRRTILVKSFTKSYALPTWRVGYIVASASLIPYFKKILEWTLIHCSYISQKVALAALEGPQDWLRKIFREFEERRNQLLAGLGHLEQFSCVLPRGGPFVFLNVSRHSNNSNQFSKDLLKEYGVPSVPGKYFNDCKDHVRIPFGGSEKSIAAVISALHDLERRR